LVEQGAVGNVDEQPQVGLVSAADAVGGSGKAAHGHVELFGLGLGQHLLAVAKRAALTDRERELSSGPRQVPARAEHGDARVSATTEVAEAAGLGRTNALRANWPDRATVWQRATVGQGATVAPRVEPSVVGARISGVNG
jgi:hypothetical protein